MTRFPKYISAETMQILLGQHESWDTTWNHHYNLSDVSLRSRFFAPWNHYYRTPMGTTYRRVH